MTAKLSYSLRGRSYISVRDFAPEELRFTLQTSQELRSRLHTGEQPKIMAGKTLGMIFQKPSLRTVVSFQVAMHQLGGNALYLGPDQISIGKRETTEDIATVLSGFVDCIMARVFGHNIVEDLAKYARVPVVNGLSDFEHPCQALGDLLTVLDRKGTLSGIKLTYVGDGNNVANSLAFICARLGVNMTVASPKGFECKSKVLELANQDAKYFGTGAHIEQVNDPIKGVKDADAVYTDVWASMGQEAEREERKKIFKDYMITAKMLDAAKPTATLLHCLPAHYGEEIADGLSKDPRSAIFPQAENRLHAQKGLLALIMAR